VKFNIFEYISKAFFSAFNDMLIVVIIDHFLALLFYLLFITLPLTLFFFK
jgi:hypothetical protein